MQIAKTSERAIRTPMAATGRTATRPRNLVGSVIIGCTADNGKEAAKRPLPTAALYGLQNLQRLDNDLSESERHRALGFSNGSRQPDRSDSACSCRSSWLLCEGKSPQWVNRYRN